MPHKTNDQDHLAKLSAINQALASAFDGVVSDPFSEMQTPPFPMELVPTAIREFAEAEAAMSGFDAGGYAICTLMSIASLIDFRSTLKVNDSWREPPMMWFGVVSESGEGKSPVIKASMQFIQEIDDAMKRSSMAKRKNWRAESDAIKASSKRNAEPVDVPPEPAMEMLVVNDSTVEALGKVLTENQHGVMYFSAELSRWISSIDAYSSGRSSKDRGAYLEGYDGGGKSINRVHGGFTYVPNWAFSVMGGIQPDVFTQIFKSTPSSSADGLYQRFMLYCMQPSKTASLCGVGHNRYVQRVRDIAGQVHDWASSGRIEMDKPALTDEALLEFQGYVNAMRELQRRTSDPRFSEHLGKFAGFALRLTLALHVIECATAGREGWTHTVGVDTLNRTLAIMATLYRHSEVMYTQATQRKGSSREILRDVANIILARRWDSFTLGELQANCSPWRDCADKRIRDDAIDLLIEMGWLLDITPDAAGRGRKPMGKFAVNPLVHQRFSEHAERERANRALRKEALDAAVASRRSALLDERAA